MLDRPKGGEIFLSQISSGNHVRLGTIIRLRWVAVFGQLTAICVVAFGYGFALPIGYCLATIALSAWLNIFLTLKYPFRTRLSAPFVTALLAYDIVQLMVLLHLTGGIANPFTMLILAPVTVSAGTLPLRNTVLLGALSLCATLVLVYEYWPLPWYDGLRVQIPFLYKMGTFAAVGASMTFLALYAWRLAKENRDMSGALAATEQVLAREQKLHALDGLAAAAAHELGTPLSTIVLVTKEMGKDIGPGSPLTEDVQLLQSQANRCREILQKLRSSPSEQDPMHAILSVKGLLDVAAAPYQGQGIEIRMSAAPAEGVDDETAPEPMGVRRPGLIYGLRNLIENAVDFARSRVDVTARWDATQLTIEIFDDGPGFSQDVLESLGDPYVTTKSENVERNSGKTSGLGLGFFIAKTLLERSGAQLAFYNRSGRSSGAAIELAWRREKFTEQPV